MQDLEAELQKVNMQKECLLKRMRALKSGDFEDIPSRSATPSAKTGGVPRSSPSARSSRSRASTARSLSTPPDDSSASEENQDTI